MLVDLGRKTEISAKPQEAPPKYYPSIYIDSLQSDIDLEDVVMDKDIKVEAVIRVTGFNKRTTGKERRTSIDIEVRKIDFGKDAKAVDLQDAIEEGLSIKDDDESEESDA